MLVEKPSKNFLNFVFRKELASAVILRYDSLSSVSWARRTRLKRILHGDHCVFSLLRKNDNKRSSKYKGKDNVRHVKYVISFSELRKRMIASRCPFLRYYQYFKIINWKYQFIINFSRNINSKLSIKISIFRFYQSKLSIVFINISIYIN